MEIIILGSGTCVPSLERYASSIWVKSGSREILLDTGSGCVKRLLEAGKELKNINTIFFSHFHPDHTGEFVSILFSLKYGGIDIKNKELFVLGGKGLLNFYEGLKKVYGRWIDANDRIRFREFDDCSADGFNFDDLKLETFPVNHRPESIALKITDKNKKSLIYTGDMDETENFHEFCKDADLLIIDCAMPDSMKKDGHLTPLLAGRTAEKSRVKKLILTHFYPECENIDIKKQASKVFSGEIELARDLKEIIL